MARYDVITATRANSELRLRSKAVAAFVDALQYHENIEFVDLVVSNQLGYVYRAHTEHSAVCVKICCSQDERTLPVEAEVLWKCLGSDAHVPTLRHVFFFDGMCALVTDWVEGTSFGVTLPDLKQYALQLLATVRYVHELGYFSRDIKPHNVLWDATTNRLTLLDFDLAARTHEVHALQVGTPGYMAPEVVARQPYGAGVDVYGCALTLLTVYEHRIRTAPTAERDAFAHEDFLRVVHRMLSSCDGADVGRVQAVVQAANF
jgi:serine/threonine protein kinase